METAEKHRKLSAIKREVDRALKEYDRQGHCIDAGALLTSVLHQKGFPDAHRLTVRVTIINEARQRFEAENGPPNDNTSRAACNAAGGAMFILGKGAPERCPGSWNGHLVVIVPGGFGSNDAMFDLTLMQANWPEVGINLPSIFVPVSGDFVTGAKTAKLRIGKSHLVYEAYPKDSSYNQWGDYMDNPSIVGVVSAIAERLKF